MIRRVLPRREFLATATAGCAAICAGPSFAQKPELTPKVEEGIAWYDAREWGVEGKGWMETARFFDRLPAKAQGAVPDPVWNLSRHSAGMLVRFETDAPAIHARYSLLNAGLALPQPPESVSPQKSPLPESVRPGLPGLPAQELGLPQSPGLLREGAFIANSRGRAVKGASGRMFFIFDKDAHGNSIPPMVLQPNQHLAALGKQNAVSLTEPRRGPELGEELTVERKPHDDAADERFVDHLAGFQWAAMIRP